MVVVKTFEDLNKALQNKEKKIQIDANKLTINGTIWLYSNIEITGKENMTTIVLEKGSNCHILSNKEPCENIRLENLRFEGNGEYQERNKDDKGLVFSCAIYLKQCHNIRIKNIFADEIRQTGLHFSSCENIKVNDVWVQNVGWSVLSTYNSSKIETDRVSGTWAGLDIQHSGIHIDGGNNIVLKNSYISHCTGNGIMFDNTAGDISNFKVEKAFVHNCKRGISLSASHEKNMTLGVLNFISSGNDVGVMVANSSQIEIKDSTIFNNKMGVEILGRKGVNGVTLTNNKVVNNFENYNISDNTQNLISENNLEHTHDIVSMKLPSSEEDSDKTKEQLLDKYKDLQVSYKDDKNNIILGSFDKENLSVSFKGHNCVCIFNKPRNTNGSIEFQADNGVFCLEENSDLKGRTRLGLNCKLIIGKNLALGGNIDFRLAEEATIAIGDDCMFAQKVLFTTDDTHPIFDVTTKQRVNRSANIVIKNHVWIAEGAKILKGTIVEEGSVIGMYSLLSHKEIPNNSVAVGNPVRVVKTNIAWEKNFVNDKPYIYNTAEDSYKNFKYYNLTKEK